MVIAKPKVCTSGQDCQFLRLRTCGHGNVARILMENVNINRTGHCKMCVCIVVELLFILCKYKLPVPHQTHFY